MLSLITPLRGLVALFVVTLVIAAWPRPHRCSDDWQLGYIQRGSLRAVDGGYTFTLVRSLGGRCAEHLLDVFLEGGLSDNVCEGVEVAVEGTQLSHRMFEAAHVHGLNNGPYDGCWQLRCSHDAYHRCRGHRHVFE